MSLERTGKSLNGYLMTVIKFSFRKNIETKELKNNKLSTKETFTGHLESQVISSS